MLNFRMAAFSISFLLAGALLTAPWLAAQLPIRGSAAVGFAFARGQGGVFQGRDLRGVHLAADAEDMLSRHVGILGKWSAHFLGPGAKQPTTCKPTIPPCELEFPGLRGWTGDLGLWISPTRFIEARAGAGIGAESYDDSDVVGLGSLSTHTVVDVTVFFSQHIGVVAAFEDIKLRRNPGYIGGPPALKSVAFALRLRKCVRMRCPD